MTDPEIYEIANQVVKALQNMAPGVHHWWDSVPSFAPFAIIAAALIAFFLGRSTIRQKREADARSEWWKRTQWALDATDSESGRMYGYGVAMLNVLVTSKLADEHDKAMLDAVWQTTRTAMDDDEIAEFLDLVDEQSGRSEAQEASLHSFYFGAENSNVSTDIAPEDQPTPEAPSDAKLDTDAVDESVNTLDNGISKEDNNGENK